jgi:hypothetical protein
MVTASTAHVRAVEPILAWFHGIPFGKAAHLPVQPVKIDQIPIKASLAVSVHVVRFLMLILTVFYGQ